MPQSAVIFSAPSVVGVTSVNPSPQPQKPSGDGVITNLAVYLVVRSATLAAPPDFEARFYVNGVLVSVVPFTETLGVNAASSFALQQVSSTDELTVDLAHSSGIPQAVDWADVTLSFVIEYEDEAASVCPQTDPCSGAYTRDDLLKLWESSVDRGFSQQMLLLGEGEGSLEHITQALEQLRIVSCAMNRTTQAMYISQWSGQSGEPAGGGRKACVELTVSRSGIPNIPVIISQDLLFAEVQKDASSLGSVEVETGRTYKLNSLLVIAPGNTEGIKALASSSGIGYGYNYPMPGSISKLLQPGSSFTNNGASVRKSNASWTLLSANNPDVIIPEHVGQYVQFLGGSNAGLICRISGYLQPDLLSTPQSGGGATLECLFIVETVVFSFTQFVVGEIVTQAATGAQGVLYSIVDIGGVARVVIAKRVGSFALGATPDYYIESKTTTQLIICDTSFYPDATVVLDQSPVEETGTASWRILDWVVDLGLSAYNAKSPTGGRSAMLDELGEERGIRRSPGESDDSYRSRVSRLADVVSPNAIKRVSNRILSVYGLEACLREVGQASMPGFFFDAFDGGYYFYDMDCAVMTGFIFGIFEDGEEVILNSTPDLLPAGTAGLAAGFFAGFDPGSGKIFVARKGLNHWKEATGNYVVGKRSGAYAQITGLVVAEGRAEDRFKTLFDYEEFRAFFTVGIQANDLGEYGFFYDGGGFSFYDAAPYYAFYDGYAATLSVMSLAVWNAINAAKAGGVKADVYRDYRGC